MPLISLARPLLAAFVGVAWCGQAAFAHPDETEAAHQHQDIDPNDPPTVKPERPFRKRQPLLPGYTPSGPTLSDLTARADRVVIGKIVKVEAIDNNLHKVALREGDTTYNTVQRLSGSTANKPQANQTWAYWLSATAPNQHLSGVAKAAGITENVMYPAHRRRGQFALSPDATQSLRSYLTAVDQGQHRQALFTLLGSRHPDLVEDAIRQLHATDQTDWRNLSKAEVRQLSAALETPGPQRAALLQWLGRQPSGEQLLLTFSPTSGPELRAWLEAREMTTQAATPAELLAYTLHPDWGFRTAALFSLARCACSEALMPFASGIANPGNNQARLLAIHQAPRVGESLLPYLAAAMLDGHARITRTSASAITRIGGDAAADTLLGIAATESDKPKEMSAAAIAARTLYAWRGVNDPHVQRLESLPQGKRLLRYAREAILPVPDMH